VEQRLSNALEGGWLRADRMEYRMEAVEVPMLGAGLVFVRPTGTSYYEWELGETQMPLTGPLGGAPYYFQRRTSSVSYDAYSVAEHWNSNSLAGAMDETETEGGSDPVANIFGRNSRTTSAFTSVLPESRSWTTIRPRASFGASPPIRTTRSTSTERG
jgi:hypothetical protein